MEAYAQPGPVSIPGILMAKASRNVVTYPAMHVDWRSQTGVVLAAMLLFAACPDGGAPGQAVGCEWFQGANCWKSLVPTAEDCAHDAFDEGTLSADGLTCTFADGTEVAFATPLDLANLDTYEWVFEISVNGAPCMSYTNTDDAPLELETAAGTFRERLHGRELGITCPDGSQFKVSDGFSLYECENFLDILPGHIATWSTDSVSFTLIGTDPDPALHLFRCVSP